MAFTLEATVTVTLTVCCIVQPITAIAPLCKRSLKQTALICEEHKRSALSKKTYLYSEGEDVPSVPGLEISMQKIKDSLSLAHDLKRGLKEGGD